MFDTTAMHYNQLCACHADVPSFVSGRHLAIFDPHCSFLPGLAADNPGKRIDFVANPLGQEFRDQVGSLLWALWIGFLSACHGGISKHEHRHGHAVLSFCSSSRTWLLGAICGRTSMAHCFVFRCAQKRWPPPAASLSRCSSNAHTSVSSVEHLESWRISAMDPVLMPWSRRASVANLPRLATGRCDTLTTCLHGGHPGVHYRQDAGPAGGPGSRGRGAAAVPAQRGTLRGAGVAGGRGGAAAAARMRHSGLQYTEGLSL